MTRTGNQPCINQPTNQRNGLTNVTWRIIPGLVSGDRITPIYKPWSERPFGRCPTFPTNWRLTTYPSLEMILQGMAILTNRPVTVSGNDRLKEASVVSEFTAGVAVADGNFGIGNKR